MAAIEQSREFLASPADCFDALQIVFSNLTMPFAPDPDSRTVLCHWSALQVRLVMEATCLSNESGSTTVRLIYRPDLIPLTKRPLLGIKRPVNERMESVFSQLTACLDSTNHPEYPRQIVESLRKYWPSRADRAQQFQGRLLRGLLLLVIGVVATAISAEAASSGGTYLVFWGAIVFGAIDLLSGLVGWLSNS